MSHRIRTIKPELLEDSVTASLSHEAFRLFVSMFVLADDHGNLRASPKYLEGQVFHSTDLIKPIQDVLRELSQSHGDHGLIQIYEVHGQQYVHINGWTKHQRVDNCSAPRVPLPPGMVARREEFAAGKFTRYRFVVEKLEVQEVEHREQPTAEPEPSPRFTVKNFEPSIVRSLPVDNSDAQRQESNNTLEKPTMTRFTVKNNVSPRTTVKQSFSPPGPKIQDPRIKETPPYPPPQAELPAPAQQVSSRQVEPPSAKPMGLLPTPAPKPMGIEAKPMGQPEKPTGSPVQDGGGHGGRAYFIGYFKSLPHLNARDIDLLAFLAESRPSNSPSLDEVTACAVGQLQKEQALGKVRFPAGWLRNKLETLLRLDAKQFNDVANAGKQQAPLTSDEVLLADIDESNAYFEKQKAKQAPPEERQDPRILAPIVGQSIKGLGTRPDFGKPRAPILAPPASGFTPIEHEPPVTFDDAHEPDELEAYANDWDDEQALDRSDPEMRHEYQRSDLEAIHKNLAEYKHSTHSGTSKLGNVINPTLLKSRVA